MNKERRKDLAQVAELIGGAETCRLVDALKARLDDAVGKLDDLVNAEVDAKDNLPESFQSGTQGEWMGEAITAMEEFKTMLEELSDSLNSLSDLESLEALL